MTRPKWKIQLEYFSYALVLIGFVMLVQPFAISIYSYGFTPILAGVILMNVANH